MGKRRCGTNYDRWMIDQRNQYSSKVEIIVCGILIIFIQYTHQIYE